MPQPLNYKQKKAQELLAERAKRTPEQQLALLDAKLGAGIGAVRERARLNAEIEARKPSKKAKE